MTWFPKRSVALTVSCEANIVLIRTKVILTNAVVGWLNVATVPVGIALGFATTAGGTDDVYKVVGDGVSVNVRLLFKFVRISRRPRPLVSWKVTYGIFAVRYTRQIGAAVS